MNWKKEFRSVVIYLFLLLIFPTPSFSKKANTPEGITNTGDTALKVENTSAYELQAASFTGITDENLSLQIDSLLNLEIVPLELLNKIKLHIALRKKQEHEIPAMLDSLKQTDNPPVEFINQVNLFLAVKGKSDAEIYHLVDSLLELDVIPHQIINQINYYVATRTHENENSLLNTGSLASLYGQSLYPADCYYESWNTEKANPYSDELWASDSVQKLMIEDSANFCNYVHPYCGPVTSVFGPRHGRNHNGVDIDLNTGEPVVAAFDGMVRVAKKQSTYGNVVVIRHYNGLETLYAHLYKIKVKPGQVINAGQVLGLGGNTGRSYGSHLHFEIRFRGKPINPAQLISFNDKQLLSQTFILKKNKSSYIAMPDGLVYHKVKKGDFPYQIAQNYGISLKTLLELNALNKRSPLKVGQQLRIN